ncbi:MAG: HD domain-containing protein [Clostridiales bacterium]|nr:HD domain-containing protein [Clostridiales bacterium]
MANYKELSKEIENLIIKDKEEKTLPNHFFNSNLAVRRKDNPHDYANAWRSAFIRDVDKILNCPFYSRYADKTQVYSLHKNDDITKRSLHVQLVSRTARTIGKALNLNLELIEAIALGHDIGHTPFGHTGESFLDEIYREKTGRRFFHNIHSVRVLDKIFPLNITLQTLDGIASHNGEMELERYEPCALNSFNEFDSIIESCYINGDNVFKMIPSTLEGCIVRISDIIAYLGKDRQDATKSTPLNLTAFKDYGIGVLNSEIINNLIVNVIENSYNKPYIKLDKSHFEALKQAKKDNYDIIYNDKVNKDSDSIIKQMLFYLYDKLYLDIKSGNKSSPIFKHHVDYINKPYYKRETPYLEEEPNQIVVDYIASMTDDYFIELFEHLFPSSNLKVKYIGYFEN